MDQQDVASGQPPIPDLAAAIIRISRMSEVLHVIEAEEFIRAFSWSSRLNADWDFLQHLYNIGRAQAEQWLEANFDRLGIELTVDLDSRYF
jgi:hypothetical protein